MTWLKVNDSLYADPTFIGASDGAVALWIRAGCWSARHATGGFIPFAATGFLSRNSGDAVRELADSGIWMRVEGGYFMAAGGDPRRPWWCLIRNGSRPRIPDKKRHLVYERDGFKCVDCGSTDDLTLDHIFPWSRGGPDTIGNLQTLCKYCNSRKGAKVLVEWGKLFANLPDDPRVQAAEADGGAAWLLVESMCYCTRAERGGFIPHTQVARFGGQRLKQRVAALVREELWLPVKGGYLLSPDVWTEERNLSDAAEKKRKADRERIAARREAERKAREAAGHDEELSGDKSRDNRATDRATGRSDSRTAEKSREDKTYTADQVGHLRVADARSYRDDDSVISAVAAAAEPKAGRIVSDDEARSAIGVIAERAERDGIVIHHPARYFAAAVRDEPDVYDLLLASRIAAIEAGERGGPPWCGRCDEDTRQLDRYGDHPRRCPDCHPGPKARTA